jgi:hypothetical protein
VVKIVDPRSGRNNRNHCFLDIQTGRHGGRRPSRADPLMNGS